MDVKQLEMAYMYMYPRTAVLSHSLKHLSVHGFVCLCYRSLLRAKSNNRKSGSRPSSMYVAYPGYPEEMDLEWPPGTCTCTCTYSLLSVG